MRNLFSQDQGAPALFGYNSAPHLYWHQPGSGVESTYDDHENATRFKKL